MWNPQVAMSKVDFPPPEDTKVNQEPFDSQDSLIFYLTKDFDEEADRKLRSEIEAKVEDFNKHVWYFPWNVSFRSNEFQ